MGGRRILESQKPPNSRNKNQQIEEPLSESSRNYKGRDLWAHQIKCFMHQILILIAPNIYLEKTPN